MGSILIGVPDINDTELVFDEAETRQLLVFFWPHAEREIASVAVDNNLRRLAQTALIAGIEASYAMGFVEQTLRAMISPGKSLKGFGKRLATRFVSHWWQHTTKKNLENVRIYETVRRDISRQLRTRFEQHLIGLAQRLPAGHQLMVVSSPVSVIWG